MDRSSAHPLSIEPRLRQVARAFRIQGAYDSFEEIKVGNVNRTYKLNYITPEGAPKSYIAQAINTYVFKDPVAVMENIDSVTEYIRDRNPGKTVLHFHHTADRRTYFFEQERDQAGEYTGFWRLFNFIPSSTYNATDDLEIIRNAGRAFGDFQTMLSGFDASRLHETIAGFHNTRRRYQKLTADVAADPCRCVDSVGEEIGYLLSVRERACLLTDLLDRGELPLRVTHNDTKINNVLFDPDTKQALAVIDLDTVMPGLIGHDFGDAIRFAANYVEEDSRDAGGAGVNMEVFQAFTEGFLEKTAGTMTPREVETLGLSCFALTVELATRFLDDYILGSPYFKIDYPEHNLARARCQIALAKDMEARMDEMNAIIRACCQRYKD